MSINLSVGFMSYSISFGVYLVMLAIFIVGQRDSPKGKPFVALISLTAIWSGLLTLSQIGASLAFEYIVVAELLRSLAWIFVFQYAMGSYSSKQQIFNFNNLLSPINTWLILLLSFVLLLFNRDIARIFAFENVNFIETILQLFFPVMGLVIVEQLYRSTPKEERWNIQILCLSASAIFVYDIFVYSNALLFNELNYDYWSARGLVNVLILPLLVLSAVRNPTLAPRVYISRQVVFHSTALMASGTYLVLVSFAAYFLKLFGGEWGSLLQIAVIFSGILLLLLVFLSKSIRLRVKNYLYTNFFSNKYDYRDEWHRFSNTLLSNSECSINERALLSVCQIMESKSAALWIYEEGRCHYAASWNMTLDNSQKKIPSHLINHILSKEKDVYVCKESSGEQVCFSEIADAWFVLPLWNQGALLGFALFTDPVVARRLDDEDKELLKTVADHIALFFSQNQASFQLMEAQKFQHISQMTAFLVHDLKTVLSQLVLMSENAKIHKSNPQFIDDMLGTIEHVATKMQRLIQQLKEPEQKESVETFDLIEHLQALVETYQHQPIEMILTTGSEHIVVNLRKESFLSALKHIIQNSVEASKKHSRVWIDVSVANKLLVIVVKDEGCGMTEQFIADHLFRPFDSSKGVSGMGVGVYQSQQFFRSVGGDVAVSSKIDKGSEFTIELPYDG